MIRIGALARALIRPKTEFRLGVSRSGQSVVHALVSVDRQNHHELLSAGADADVPVIAKLLVPGIVATDIEQTPVFLYTEAIGNETPESWLDKNESKIIPPGATADTIVNEYMVIDSTIYSATVLKQARDAAVASHAAGLRDMDLLSLSLPLWNLATLYCTKISQPFILWKITANGSILGLVDKGHLTSLVNCWIGCDDLIKDTVSSAMFLSQLIKQIAGQSTIPKVVLFSPEPSFALPSGFVIPGCSLAAAPGIHEVPAYCHEAYANGCFGANAEMDFLPFEKMQKARKLNIQARRLFSSLRIGIGALLALLLLFACTDMIFGVIGRTYQSPMEILQAQESIVKGAEKRRSALIRQLADKTRFAAERSRVTTLISDLQTIFPENSQAEGLSINGTGQNAFQADIDAITHESGLINNVLQNVRGIKGVSNARLVSSEQASQGRAIRFKITFDWQDKR